MTDPPITTNLNPKKLGRLFKLYSEVEEKTDSSSNPEQQKTLLLTNFLSGALPLDSGILRELPRLMQEMYGEKQRVEGTSLHELLLDPKTPLIELEAAKELAKKKVNATQSQAEKEVATVVYYTAIAAAISFHGEKITQHSDEQLIESFDSLMHKEWILDKLKDLFRNAVENCRTRLSDEQNQSPNIRKSPPGDG